MGSRIRENPEKLFEVFLEIAKPEGQSESPFVVQTYPIEYDDEETLKSVPGFAFPCDTERTTVDHFTFVLTEIDSTLKFGYCRHATGAQTCLCIVSYLPWFEVFYNLLNQLAEMMNRNDDNDLTEFLRAAYAQDIPLPNVPVTIVANQEMLNFTAPEPNKLPTIPGNRNLTEYYNALDTTNMMYIFASMLHERRILVTSKKLSRLTACVHASVSLLYPMFWQHLFIPVLPSKLIDYLSAPMPYVIGIHSTLLVKIRESELGDAVIVDVDNNTIKTSYDDLEDLPSEVSSYLRRNLKSEKVRMSMQTAGDAIPKTFLMALVRLIGGYRDALKFKPGEPITFDPEAFVQSRPQNIQPFLEYMLHLQIFQQFINDRLDMLNCGQGFSDIFEAEALANADKLNTQTRYKDWLTNMKKQGNKFQKGGKDIWAGIKEKVLSKKNFQIAAPVMSSAVHSVKSQGKKAYTGFKNKIGDLKKEEDWLKPSKTVKNYPNTKKLDRERPSTIAIGQELKSARPPRPSPTDPSMRDKIISQPHRDERISRYKMITIEEKSLDDTDAELAYNRVSVNLLSDPDIQYALNKAASAEDLLSIPLDRPLITDSEAEVSSSAPSSGRNSPSSTSTSSALDFLDRGQDHRKTDSFGSVPFIDVSSEDEYVTMSSKKSHAVLDRSSGEEIYTPPSRPVAPPRRAKDHYKKPVSDRLIGSGRSHGTPRPTNAPPPPPPHLSLSQPPPRPSPRNSLLRDSQASHLQNAAPLIEFHSNELEDTLDPFASKTSPTVPQIDRLRELNTSIDNAGNNVSSSLNRTPAFRQHPPSAPKQGTANFDSVSDRRDISTAQTTDHAFLDFDPLSLSTSATSEISKQNQQDTDQSPELLQSWDMGLLTKTSNSTRSAVQDLGPMPVKGFVQRTVAEFSAGSPSFNAQNYSPVNRKVTPTIPPRPGSVATSSPYSSAITASNPFYQTDTNFNNAGLSKPTSGGKQDPFDDLAGLNLGPTPTKSQWQTFE